MLAQSIEEASMCGRYLLDTTPAALRAFFAYAEQPNFPARCNVAPTQPIPIVRLMEGKRQFALVRWGLIPAWVKDPRGFGLLINARGESVNDKPAFKNAMKRRRCLIPADGFYEWREGGGNKRPYVVRPRAGGPIAFAGLWECWMGPNGEELETAAIVTTEANRTLRAIHHRMPVIWRPMPSISGSTAPMSTPLPPRPRSRRRRTTCSKPTRFRLRSTAWPTTRPRCSSGSLCRRRPQRRAMPRRRRSPPPSA
jgi:putative SOS response-associated peptidase YedK